MTTSFWTILVCCVHPECFRWDKREGGSGEFISILFVCANSVQQMETRSHGDEFMAVVVET